MKLAWVEDFLTLVDAGTFSKAAALRNVTQPAFSRRIQMFEDWLGVELVNRRSRRLQLTGTATRFEPELRRLVSRCYEVRSRMLAESLAEQRIALTSQHTLMVTHLPRLLRFFRERQLGAAFSVRTGNLEDCIAQLTHGEADLLLCFELENEPLPGLATGELERSPVGIEQLVPVTARNKDGGPLFDPQRTRSIGLLSYPGSSFLGKVVRERCLPELVRDHTIEIVCETAFSVGVKEMALSGMGIAWLPYGLVERELECGSLLALHDSLSAPSLIIAVYRVATNHYPPLEEIWSVLQTDGPRL